MAGIEPASQVRVDRRQERFPAAARPMPQGQWGALENLTGEEIEWGGVTSADGPVRNLNACKCTDPTNQGGSARRPVIHGRLDPLSRSVGRRWGHRESQGSYGPCVHRARER